MSLEKPSRRDFLRTTSSAAISSAVTAPAGRPIANTPAPSPFSREVLFHLGPQREFGGDRSTQIAMPIRRHRRRLHLLKRLRWLAGLLHRQSPGHHRASRGFLLFASWLRHSSREGLYGAYQVDRGSVPHPENLRSG